MLVNWNVNKTDKYRSGKKEKLNRTASGSTTKVKFENEMAEALGISLDDDVFDTNNILERLNEMENSLIDHPNQQNFYEYKAFIKMLAEKLLKHAFKKAILRDSKKRQYEIIKTIDDEMAKLYGAIVQNSPNRQKISVIVGTIKGIILDLTV